MRILVTGGAGFIGSAVIRHIIENTEDSVINVDKLTYAGNLESLSSVANDSRYSFEQVDICNREALDEILVKYQPEVIMHLAAESHVDRSIDGPAAFIETNIIGTYTLLETCRHYWNTLPDDKKAIFKFHHISTDEVYGTLNETDLFTENTPYAPNSPYSASKASSDMIVRSYQETYGLNTVITNCSNNYGPKQHDEKLIPTIIRKALNSETIPIYGDGKNIRDWLYVFDHCKGIDLVFHNGKQGGTYNIGGKNERTNLQIANAICEILDKKHPVKNNSIFSSYKSLITFVEDRAGHDRRYAIDATKLEDELGWKADENFDTGIIKTIEWYLDKYRYKREACKL